MPKKYSVLEKIKLQLSDLTPGQKDVADFVLKNPLKFLVRSVRELENDLGVSKSTVVRLSQRLGYEGFNEFKAALWADVEGEKYPVTRYSEYLKEGSHVEDPIRTISNEVIENINSTANDCSPHEFAKAIELINSARRVYTIGLGISYFLSQTTAYLLNRVTVPAFALGDSGLTFKEQIVNFEKDDLLLAFSYPPYSPETIQATEFCSKRELPLILLTDSFSNTACEYSDVVLTTNVQSMTMANAIMSPLTLIYALTFQIGCNRRTRTVESIDSLKDAT